MKTQDCKSIRREIDEANLEAPLTFKASEHLSRCEECRRFQTDRHTLRSLMADLEMVGAPADFDFRLRARMARERPSNGFGSLLLIARPIAAVALIIVIALVVLVVKSRMSVTGHLAPMSDNSPQQSTSIPRVSSPLASLPAESSKSVKEKATAPEILVKKSGGKQRNQNAGNTAVLGATNSFAPNGKALRTRDSAGMAADVVTLDSVAAFLQVPVDSRAFKVSIDNGRGGARTISLPPVSFGSQRLLAREASFMPVSSSKGDW
jgi:hypothetical protein